MHATQYDLRQDFAVDVLEASHELPILVDFWAEWCGPCRILGPTLERLAAQDEGIWRLVKVNTEEHPELAQRYGIQGIPAVKLFHKGQVIDEFVGALPESSIRSWLQQALPTRISQRYQEALEALDAGERTRAIALLQATVDEDETNVDARVRLAQLLFLEDRARAMEVARQVPPEHPDGDLAQGLVLLARLADLATRDGDFAAALSGGETPPRPEAVRRYREGAAELAAGRYGPALEAFIEVMGRDRALDDDGARQACIAVFRLLGEESEITRAYRRQFSSALY